MNPLPDAEYFAFHMPSESVALTLTDRARQIRHDERNEEYFRRYCEFWKSLDPEWQPDKPLPSKLFTEYTGTTSYNFNVSIKIPPELVPRFTCFKRPMPQKLWHFDEVVPHGYFLNDYADCPAKIVSDHWRMAIEAEDPGVHDFYPHELRFKNGRVEYFIFRDRAVSEPVVLEKSDSRTFLFGGSGPPTLTLNSQPKYLTARRSAMRATAWQYVVGPAVAEYFWIVKRSLASRLRPLLPRGSTLMSISVVD